MKKCSHLLLILISFFFGFKWVSAGVCEGKTMYDSGYCYLGTQYQYPKKTTTNTYNNRHYAKDGSSGYLGYGYEASFGTFSGSSEYAFCLDPAKLDPTSYSYGREIDTLNSSYDKDVYKAYQYYVNSVAYAKNNGNYTDANKHKYLAFTDVVLRIYTAAYGYDLGISENSPYYYYNILPYIIGDNKSALKNHIGNSVDELYSNPNTSGSCKVMDSNLSNFGSCGKAWASSKDSLNEVKTYFNTVFDGSVLWENPLSVTPKVETDSEGNYVFSFEVKFKKDNFAYFGVSASEAHYDYDIGHGHAFFNFLEFTINGVKYDSSYGTTVIPKTNISASNGSNANGTVTYKLTIPKDKYEELKIGGKVDVKMKYQTYHPMSSDNVFVNYLNPRTEAFSSTYQRMIVFTKFVNEKSVGIDSNVSTNCTQEGNTFKVNGVEKTLEDYIRVCGCTSINSEVLSSENKNTFNTECSSAPKVTVTSNLNACDVSSDQKDYEISYKEERVINDYCSLTCTETVNINSLVSKNQNLSVKAGMYFKLPQYPELISTKTCTVNVKYTEWQNKYKEIISELPSKYNLKEKYQNALYAGDVCCIPSIFACLLELPEYSTAYYSSQYSYGRNIISSGYKSESWDYCLGGDFSSEKATAISDYNNAITDLNNLLNDLNTCTNTIKNMGLSNEEYYTFNNQMNFYYEQEYSKSSIGVKYNDERPKNVSDAELVFDSVSDSNSAESGYIPSTQNYYNGIGTSGNGTETSVSDSGYSSYTRTVKYNYGDSRSDTLKYTDSYTGEISSLPASLENPITLGYVYDVDVSAKAKMYENYYQFLALGDENKIYNHFSQGKNVTFTDGQRVATLDDLKRVCEYEVTNELLQTSDGGDESTKLNIVYRVVDPNNIDPNNRLLSNEGFWNWRNTLGEIVKAKIEQDDTYNPDNLEYSFELNSATLKEIREYNSEHDYSDYNLECVEGEKCISDFVTEYSTSLSGRNTWKNVTTDGGEVKIDGEKVEVVLD